MLITYIPLANLSISEGLVRDARATLGAILSHPDHQDLPKVLYILRFLTRHRTLRQRFVAHDQVIGALMFAVEQTPKSTRENLFPLVMDSLCYLIDDGAYDQHHLVYMFILCR